MAAPLALSALRPALATIRRSLAQTVGKAPDSSKLYTTAQRVLRGGFAGPSVRDLMPQVESAIRRTISQQATQLRTGRHTGGVRLEVPPNLSRALDIPNIVQEIMENPAKVSTIVRKHVGDQASIAVKGGRGLLKGQEAVKYARRFGSMNKVTDSVRQQLEEGDQSGVEASISEIDERGYDAVYEGDWTVEDFDSLIHKPDPYYSDPDSPGINTFLGRSAITSAVGMDSSLRTNLKKGVRGMGLPSDVSNYINGLLTQISPKDLQTWAFMHEHLLKIVIWSSGTTQPTAAQDTLIKKNVRTIIRTLGGDPAPYEDSLRERFGED